MYLWSAAQSYHGEWWRNAESIMSKMHQQANDEIKRENELFLAF